MNEDPTITLQVRAAGQTSLTGQVLDEDAEPVKGPSSRWAPEVNRSGSCLGALERPFALASPGDPGMPGRALRSCRSLW